MLVDDAIIVAENIYQKYEKGVTPFKAALEGTTEVFAPVFTAVATTMLAFTPFFFFAGGLGKMIWQVALVVIGSLAFSLVESMLILPTHLAHSRGLKNPDKVHPLRKRIEGFYQHVTHKIFAPLLKKAMHNKFVTIAIALAGLFITNGLVKGGLVEISGFPHIPRDNFSVNISLTSGT